MASSMMFRPSVYFGPESACAAALASMCCVNMACKCMACVHVTVCAAERVSHVCQYRICMRGKISKSVNECASPGLVRQIVPVLVGVGN